MLDLLLKNGMVVDGGGGAPFRADVGVKDGKITGLAPCLEAEALRVIDAQGCVVTPGFIDIHRHADARVLLSDFGEGELRQGLTTIVNGNCGLSIAPCAPAHREAMRDYLRPITGSLPQGAEFETMGAYMNQLDAQKLPLHTGMLVGSGALRMAVNGFAPGPLDAPALARLQGYLEDALQAGVLGVSLGLAYLPDAYNTEADLIRALAPLAGRDVPIVTHMRDEGDTLADSAAEVIAVAAALDAPLHVSHYKCIGRRNWDHGLAAATAHLDAARAAGQDVTCDAYPYTAGSTQLVHILPPSFQEGGPVATARRLRDPGERARCRAVMESASERYENIVNAMGWEAIAVSGVGSEKNRRWVGQNIADIAAARGVDEYTAAFDLLAEEECDVAMVDTIASEEDIETILRLPYGSVISDAVYPDKGLEHPRNYGAFPRVIAEYVQRRGVLTLPQAVRKMTALPAAALRIPGKGLLREGGDADINVFRPEEISAPADYKNPRQCATGFRYVIVAGGVAVENDTLTGGRFGRAIRRRARP